MTKPINPDTINVGDRVVVSERYGNLGPRIEGGEHAAPGSIWTVASLGGRNGYPNHLIGIEGVADGSPQFGYEWFDEAEPEQSEQPERPLIDFSGSSRETAREYARNLQSRVNNDDTNAVLLNVSLGKSVDAYALNEAVLDTMRGVCTRFGQSTQRRLFAKQAAYLGHITQAVLENHADGLPVYAEGQRSRRIESLEEVLNQRQAYIRDLESERDEAARDAETLRGEVAALKTASADYKAVADAEVEKITAERDDHAASADMLGLSLVYAVERLAEVKPAEVGRVLGFMDGIAAE